MLFKALVQKKLLLNGKQHLISFKSDITQLER